MALEWDLIVATNQDVLLFKLLTFLGVLLTKRYYCLQLYGNLCLNFARQARQDGKKRKENHTTKVTKIPINKGWKYGGNKKQDLLKTTFMTLNKIFDYLTLFPPVWNQTTILLILLII